MLDIYFVTFGDTKYRKTLDRIRKEALAMDVFKEIFVWNENDLDTEWLQKHAPFINNHRRGYGYWIWKPQVIRQALLKIPKGSVLVYADAGCTLNVKGRSMLVDLCGVAKDQSTAGIVALEMSFIESHWTKMDLMRYMNYDAYNSKQVQAGISFWSNCDNARSFVNEWADICAMNNYHFLDDSPSIAPNDKAFREHRHDQSIFSLLMKTRKGRLFPVWPHREEYPIVPSRLRF